MTNTASCFLQVIQPEASSSRERLRSGKTILPRCRWKIFSELQCGIYAGQSCKKTALQQTEKCLPPMCQLCFLSVAGSQLPKPTRLKGPLGASRALFRFCSPVRNLQPLCEELGVICSRPSACPTGQHWAQCAHMLSWFSTEEKLKAGFMPG